jgi:sensor histidine kinase YesM
MEYPLTTETTCIKGWYPWFCEPVSQNEQLEFHLHNPHKAGNVNAYNEFLESIYACPEMMLQGQLQQQSRKVEIIALLFLTISLVLLGMAGGSVVIDHELGQKLWPFGLLTLFMGGYVLFDKQMDVINYSRDILFTNMQRLCMMFAAYEVSFIVQCEINEKRENKLPPIVFGLSVFNIGLLLVTSFGNIMLYNTLITWQIVQGIVFGILTFNGIKTLLQKPLKKWSLLLSGIILMVVIFIEFINGYLYLWKQGLLWKTVFLICLLHHLLEAARTVPKNYRASKETERLKRELKNSRVVLAMSQIRTHFIFNVLNAISGMCLYDPAQANQTVVHFAKYLRGNINILQDDELIPFRKELEHLEDYIVLEKVRFEDRIQFVKELEVEEFLIPPLILQPIVENAIKHGLLRTKKGGTIKLKTKSEKDQIVIEITDNGVGFDTSASVRDGAVGISNVKFRLEYMIKGKIEIASVPKKGTTVTIRLPYVVL